MVIIVGRAIGARGEKDVGDQNLANGSTVALSLSLKQRPQILIAKRNKVLVHGRVHHPNTSDTGLTGTRLTVVVPVQEDHTSDGTTRSIVDSGEADASGESLGGL
jgi:hypothetical protein